jgi:hypothetical protein
VAGLARRSKENRQNITEFCLVPYLLETIWADSHGRADDVIE